MEMIYKTTILGHEISDIARVITTPNGLTIEVKIKEIDFYSRKHNRLTIQANLFGKIWVEFQMDDIDSSYKDEVFINALSNGFSMVICDGLNYLKK